MKSFLLIPPEKDDDDDEDEDDDEDDDDDDEDDDDKASDMVGESCWGNSMMCCLNAVLSRLTHRPSDPMRVMFASIASP